MSVGLKPTHVKVMVRMRPFPADADARTQKSGQSAPKDAGTTRGRTESSALPPPATPLAKPQTPASSAAAVTLAPSGEPQRGRLETRYQAHKRVALGAISSKPTAASGLPANPEPKTDGPEGQEEAMRQAWNKVFGKKS